ncbi:MAG: sugar phosphate isomerase/epimerase family protein [Lachnospiraceae bacterium]|jgi:sugar phosphate isomerase/epimerase
MLSFGMRCHDICPKMPMEELFQEVRANQIDQIQLAFGKSISDYDFSVGHYSAGFGRYIASLLEKNQIHVAVLGCYINPIHPIESMRQAEVAKFIEHLKYAKMIGADMVGTETGRLDPDMKVTPETFTETAYQRLLKSMREIVSVAEKLGVIVGVEGVFNHTLYSPAMMKRFLEDIDSPNVEVILDSINLIHPDEVDRQEEVIDKAFAYYGDKITMLHMKDFVFDGSSQIFRHVGEGLFRYEPLMKHLKEEKPHITMLLENSNKERYHSDVEFLKEIYDRV